nr:hypothetical protein [Spiroplasma endosymbiont of Phyllotreta cruciferae]
MHAVVRQEVRRQILIDKTRLDGSHLDEIRPLTSEIDVLPVVHGSALFAWGETQVLLVVTLGALREKALLQIIPSEKVFPYTIRIVSEVLESNGSTSQASICAATLALMAAGVLITSPVVGIAMCLVKEDDNRVHPKK